MKKNRLFLCFLGLAIVGCQGQDNKNEPLKSLSSLTFEEKQKRDIWVTATETKLANPNPDFNFRVAAKKVTPGVVHIKSIYPNAADEFYGTPDEDFWRHFFNGKDL